MSISCRCLTVPHPPVLIHTASLLSKFLHILICLQYSHLSSFISFTSNHQSLHLEDTVKPCRTRPRSPHHQRKTIWSYHTCDKTIAPTSCYKVTCLAHQYIVWSDAGILSWWQQPCRWQRPPPSQINRRQDICHTTYTVTPLSSRASLIPVRECGRRLQTILTTTKNISICLFAP